MIENSLIIEIYNKWLSICAMNEGSMGNIYDFKALDFVFNIYELRQDEKEECLNKIIIISNTIVEMNKTARNEQERIKQRFEDRDRIRAKGSKTRNKKSKEN